MLPRARVIEKVSVRDVMVCARSSQTSTVYRKALTSRAGSSYHFWRVGAHLVRSNAAVLLEIASASASRSGSSFIRNVILPRRVLRAPILDGMRIRNR